MTREEAIHFAECLKNNWTINLDDLKDFCDTAIEALSKRDDAEPIPHWRGQMDGCLPFQAEEE